MPTRVNVHEAKTSFSKLLARIEKGEEIVVCKSGKPVARLVPIGQRPPKRTPGTAKGKIVISADFDSVLPGAILDVFEK
jgi:prevent-host-death family protein